MKNQGFEAELLNSFRQIMTVSAAQGLNLLFNTLGKRNRGLSVIGSLRHLVGPDKLTEEDAKTAIILGWCVEWVG